MKKRVLSMILVLFLVVSLIPASARAADYYNAQQAVAWALNESEHLNTVNQGLVCSQYCLRCLQAGGLAIPESCGQYPNRLSTWAVEHGVGTMLPTNDSGISQMRAGDLVIVYCENHGQAYSYGIHCIFVTSIESSGFRYCANNNYFHNEYMSFAALKTYKNSFSCYTHAKANVQTFILHMQSVSPAAPAAPSVSVSGTDVTVTWNDVANETGYDAYLIQEPWGWNDVRYSVHAGPDYCHYTFTNVAPGTYAAFVISRPNSDQTQSGWTVFEVPALPAAPTVNVSPVSLYEGQSMTVSWNTVPGATSYYVRVYDPSTEVDFYGNNVGTATSQTLTFGPGKAGTYNVVVCSVNSAGGYTPSSPITVTVREGNILAQGSCGDNVTWTLDKNWTLTINGTGAIADYNQVGSLPWESYKTNIKSVVIGSGVTRIGGSDFFECSNLKSVTIPSSVTSIGNNAFDGCSSLTSVTIPAGMTSIEMFAFAYCSSLTSVTIPDGMTSIGDAVFKGCSNLTSVTIPASVTNIYSQAFYNCSSLQDVYYSGTEAQKEAITIGNYNSPLLNANWSYIGTCGDHVTWRFSNGVLTISGTGAMADYSSNNSPWEDFKANIKSVVIETGVTRIGTDAFYGCNSLESVTIPAGVTSIGSYSFSNCSSLTSVTIPAGVTIIEHNAFRECSSLTSVTIPDSVTVIGGAAFYACNSLASVTIPEGVTSIGGYVFWGCSSLRRVTIPSSVTSIGYAAFYNCSSLTSVTIPESVTNIENWAFGNCSSLTSVAIPDGVTSIGELTFYGCSSLTSVTIPASVTSVGESAFYRCSSLQDVYYSGTEAQKEAITISNYNSPLLNANWRYILAKGTCGENVTWVLEQNGTLTISGTGAMTIFDTNSPWANYKATIKSVVIEPGVTSVGRFAFSNCDSLTSVMIPAGVTSIGDSAFFNCSSLTSVTIPASVTSIGAYAFSNCDSLTSVTIPAGVTSIGSQAFSDCDSLTSITIPGSVTGIESYAFYYCTSLTSVTIQPGVTSIGAYAFCECNNLTSISIPDSVTSIWGLAFCNCSSLTDIKIPDGVTFLGERAFIGCSSLTSVTIPDGVTSIYKKTFQDCANLTSVSIPASVTSIGSEAFVNCNKLTDVHFCGTEAQREAMTIADGNYNLTNASWTYGHLWDAGVVTQEPTTTSEGLKTFTCTACGETKTEAIPCVQINPFTDVAAGKFYYAPVLWAISQDPQITTGVTATTFAPDRICTRAHVVTFLWRANGCPEPKLTANPFKDVPKDKYYYKAVLWAAENGITTGYADNTFRPDDECSRGQVVTFLWRAKGQPKPTSTYNPFADVASGQYYTTAVLWALETGVTNGRTATLFGTTDACTRGHVVTFLYRAYAD